MPLWTVIHFYGCGNNNSNMSSPVRIHCRVDISAAQISLNRPFCWNIILIIYCHNCWNKYTTRWVLVSLGLQLILRISFVTYNDISLLSKMSDTDYRYVRNWIFRILTVYIHGVLYDHISCIVCRIWQYTSRYTNNLYQRSVILMSKSPTYVA